MTMNPRTPVLIGTGQINQRDDVAEDPVSLMAAAARHAGGPAVLKAVDAIRVVNLLSWRYRDPGLLLGAHIGAAQASTGYSGLGGNAPQTLLNRACVDIQRGRADVVLLVGAETWRTRTRLRARGERPDWQRQDDSVAPANGGDDVPMGGKPKSESGSTGPHTSTRSSSRRCGSPRARPATTTDAGLANCRGDLAAQPDQSDGQLAVHQVDECQ